MESPAMVPQGMKTKKSFIMSLYRYAARANKVSQKPEPEATPISSKKVNIMTRQLSCRDTNVNKIGSAVYQERRLVSCCNEDEISKQKSKMLVAVEGGRRSVSQVETSLKSVISFLQVKVMVTDMPGFMQVHAFKVARTSYDSSLDKLSSKHIAFDIKKEFDRAYGPAWHCIVGSGFGSFVTHSTGGFLYFSMDKLCILLFQTKVLKASSC